CYVLQNNTDSVQTWHFQYAKPLPGAKTELRLAPHARFPASRDWCWGTPSDYYAIARIDSGTYATSWQGTLVIGNGSNASPSGTYSLEPVKRSSTVPYMGRAKIILVARSCSHPLSTSWRRAQQIGTPRPLDEGYPSMTEAAYLSRRIRVGKSFRLQ